MNAYTTETLIPSTTYGVPSGNYDGSSLDWAGNAVIGANYYGGENFVQTFITDISGFTGKLIVQGSLENPQFQAEWFDIITYDYTLSGPTTDVITETVTGNFVWLKIRVVDFTAGTINSITVSY